MKEALKEARKAYKKDEVPVGAVIVKDGEIIARAHNVKEQKKDTTKHAEIIAIQKASKKLESWRLRKLYNVCYFRTMCNVYGSNDSGKIEKGCYWNHG